MPRRRSIAQSLFALVSDQCPRCGMRSDDGFCAGCRGDFARVASPCRRCGLPEPCGRCPALAEGWPVASVFAPFVYAPDIAEFVQALKYRNERRLGRVLGELLLEALLSRHASDLPIDGSVDAPVDAIVPVPVHLKRLRQRR
ncbi:MAG: hypothetical protein R3305_12345, partial [Gammaproteobacteria bacterium]|nr:hypothetical protein [Gammaproteobacteria bacterium]